MSKRTTIAARTFMFAVGATAMVLLALAQADFKVTWSPNLNLKSIEDIPKRLREPQGSERLRFAKAKESREVGTCEEYLDAVGAGFAPATNYDNRKSAQFVHDCYVLRDLEHARAATSSAHYLFNADSLTQLPPLLVVGAREVTDAAEQAEKRGESWKQFDPGLKITRTDIDSMNAEDKDTFYFLTFRAWGDFNGSGVEQIAVFAQANGKHSTWAHAEYMILMPASNGRLVRLTDDRAPYRLKAQTEK